MPQIVSLRINIHNNNVVNVFIRRVKIMKANMKVLFNDMVNVVTFAFKMACDVNRYLKEERDRETLCLEL